MGSPMKRQFLDFKVPSTTQGHLRTVVKKKKKNGKKVSKITKIKRALQSAKENSGKAGKSEWNTALKKKGEKKKKKLIQRSYTKCYEEQNHSHY